MIALWGLPTDPPLVAVREELVRLGSAVALIDQMAGPETELILESGGNCRTLSGRLSGPGIDMRFEDVTALYARPYGLEELRSALDVGPGSAEDAVLGEVEMSLAAWWSAFPG